MKNFSCFLFLFSTMPIAKVFAEEEDGIVFIVQPKICVLATYETYCTDEVEILWESKSNRSLCLYKSFMGNDDVQDNDNSHMSSNEAIRCWEDTSQGTHELLINTKKSIDFYLKEVGHEGMLTSQSFKVIQDTQRYRRRHRNPWSFF